jgi:hypothetical protein
LKADKVSFAKGSFTDLASLTEAKAENSGLCLSPMIINEPNRSVGVNHSRRSK